MAGKAQKIWIGIDVGTSGLKALAVDESGKAAASALVEYGMQTPKPGWAEQDPKQWWEGLKKAISLLKKKVPRLDDSLSGIGLTGQMHSSVFLDAGFKVIRPAILWCDQRPARECEELIEKIGFERLVSLTLNRALTGFTLPKLLWLKNREPKNYARLKHLLVCKDYIRFKLTAELATEVSDASGTLMFDVQGRKWSNELIDKLGIDPTILPRCYESPEITGYLTKAAALELGLKPGVPVMGGGGDQAAGAVGNGIVEEGAALISIGTSGVVFAAHKKPLLDKQARLHSFCHAAPGLWHSMGVMLSAGGSLRWLRETLREVKPGIDYPEMTRLAKKTSTGANGLFFLPYLTGERTPHFDPFARGVFFGISLKNGLGDMARAVIEGVSFGLKDSVEIMKESGVKIKRFYLSGGGAKSEFWSQLLADILQSKIYRLKVDEGPSFGSAMLAMVGTGIFPNVQNAGKQTLKLKDSFDPELQTSRRYQELYQAWRTLYPMAAEKFKEFAKS
jgi:xylulokinase